MRTYLTSFASPEFETSQAELTRTALVNAVNEVRAWTLRELRETPFYLAHRTILDQPRGAGYWLWKPYILQEALARAVHGDIVIYADAGIAVLRSLSPLLALCRNRGVLLFAGHYDGARGRPHVCSAWTKRDCFVLTGCDTTRFHRAPMVDAACLVLVKNQRSASLVDEWLQLCRDPRILTDAPNQCGLDNLPEFVDHRHDQSVLSLLAARDRRELFRSPTQFGNHCKPESLREASEWVRQPYGSGGIFFNSPYPTLLFHHRKKTLNVLRPMPRTPRLLEVGTREGVQVQRLSATWRDARCTQLEIAETVQGAHWCALRGTEFQVVVSHASSLQRILSELEEIRRHGLLDGRGFVLCWDQLDGLEGWATFRSLRGRLGHYFAPFRVAASYGFLEPPDAGGSAQRTVGLISGTMESREAARPSSS